MPRPRHRAFRPFARCLLLYGMQPQRPLQQKSQRRSDNVKLSFEVCRAVWLRFVGSALENLAKASDFQAEYEGSISLHPLQARLLAPSPCNFSVGAFLTTG